MPVEVAPIGKLIVELHSHLGEAINAINNTDWDGVNVYLAKAINTVKGDRVAADHLHSNKLALYTARRLPSIPYATRQLLIILTSLMHDINEGNPTEVD